ncbi:MAG: ribonuclease Y [Firmicutes bacterium]|nr:ribonuclease Y [Bacillota bacterium]
MVWIIILSVLPSLAVGAFAGVFIYKQTVGSALSKSKESADRLISKAMSDAGTIKKEALLEAKEESHKLRVQIDNEIRERRSELQRTEQRIISLEENVVKKEQALDNKALALETQKGELEVHKTKLQTKLQEVEVVKDDSIKKLESISKLTKDQAKKELINLIETDAKAEAANLIIQIESEAKENASKKAREIIVSAVQRCAADHSSEVTVSTISIANDEIKGKLIGREGRNIRAIEAETGVDLIIDDTPEAITISSFDPVRREIARISIEKLIADGRIHPARIEEIVAKTTKELENTFKEVGERAAFSAKVHGLHPEVIKMLGRLKYRTSYGQNVLNHSTEVAMLSATLATELGANVEVARRAGLLHDIGKATSHEVEGTHTQIGVELAKKYRESNAVLHAIEAHHEDVPFNSVEAIIVYIADAISSARPGARRENLENYIQRLKKLEEIATSFKGVEKCFAISAGREVRIIVRPEEIDDKGIVFMAKDVAKRIENELDYPGVIKVNVIRETRANETAK